MRILSALQPSGRQHLGNYFGAIRQFAELQEVGEALYFIANLHALNTVRDPALLRELTLDAAMTCLAFGIDPERSILFRQSDVPEHAELFWILGTLVPLADLHNAHSYKDKIAQGHKPLFGLFAYPVLMAADILVYDAHQVPVGKDQTQHLEFARDWATKFNLTYVKGYSPADPEGEKGGSRGVFRLPQGRIQEATQVVVGTDGRKMSKSYKNTLELFAPDAKIKKAIMGITTDSTPVEAPKPTADNALYAMMKLLAPPEEFAALDESWRAGGQGYGVYKKRVLELFHARFDGPRARHQELQSDLGEVDRILKRGSERARELAAQQLDKVRAVTGI